MEIRKLPIGIQDFEDIRKGNYLYVDKTQYVYNLVHFGKPYFLSRPRRFGKSLFLSTLRAYFEGKKELFRGLKIEELEKENPDAWQEYPVFYFDFNKKNFRTETAIEEVLISHLMEWEAVYGDEYSKRPIEERFQRLIVKAVETTGRNAVVLVDEYDKPLLEVGNEERLEHNKAVFKGFFSTLKSYDRYLKFVFLTGVTKFYKVSIFSDLNQLRDISLLPEYSGICGITEEELIHTLEPEIDAFAVSEGISKEECLGSLKRMYDGYHFSYDSVGVYNPFSLLNALQDKHFNMYWFSTGTPTFLIEKLKSSGFDAKQITSGELYASENILTDYRYDNPNPIPLFYQTGYLTITGYDKKYRSYQLNYPNDEVKYGFLESLAPLFLNEEKEPDPLDIRSFGRDIDTGNTDGLRDRFTALFSRLPYPNDEKTVENNFQNVIYIVFMLLGQYTRAEVHSSKGRADCVVETDDYVYIFEFKRDKTAADALKQIEDMGYAKPYAADKRKLIKIGVSFDSKERSVSGWLVE
ncbi:MAG: ATP-binding protein [Lachnospiraceae bacterium]|nr:ATP-binding protein [Lachnospiraceae bacterium]